MIVRIDMNTEKARDLLEAIEKLTKGKEPSEPEWDLLLLAQDVLGPALDG